MRNLSIPVVLVRGWNSLILGRVPYVKESEAPTGKLSRKSERHALDSFSKHYTLKAPKTKEITALQQGMQRWNYIGIEQKHLGKCNQSRAVHHERAAHPY